MSELHAQLGKAIDGMEDRLRAVSTDIFEHPEVKFEETRASKLLADELAKDGFEVELGAAGLETAIYAVHPAKSDGPTVAILGEYDALPEIGHACGHNLIAASGLGAALALGSIKSEIPGTLIFMGTPAEEGGGGKVLMINAGLFEGVDAAMMFRRRGSTRSTRSSRRSTGSTRCASTSRTGLESTASSATAASSRTSCPSTHLPSSTFARWSLITATSCWSRYGAAPRARRSPPARR